VSGSCPYGKRCCFIHTELPASGAPPGADGAPPPQIPDGRARSLSTNSDPNEQSISLLARISAKRKEEASGTNSQNSSSTPVDVSPPPSGYQFNSRPPTGSLRVDTSVLDSSTGKQNKSAYPTFASNVMVPQNDQASTKSPVPATAGPDLGRHNNSRLEIVGYNQVSSLRPSRASKPNDTPYYSSESTSQHRRILTSVTRSMEPRSISTTSAHRLPLLLASRPPCECRLPTATQPHPLHHELMATHAPAAQVIGAASLEAVTSLLPIHNHLVRVVK
jgi:hypothetical protein